MERAPAKKRKTSDTPSRNTPFQRTHLMEFGLEITQSTMSGVTAVACLFCKRLGRADNDGRTRKRTTNTKYYEPPFRKENFKRHAEAQHPIEFAEYTALACAQKKTYFDAKKRVQESMHRFLNAQQTALAIPVSKGIVEVVIGDMFFKPELDEDDEEMEPITKVNALKLFHKQADESYVAKVSNPVMYDLVLQHTSVGLSFRQTAAVIGQHKDAFGNARLAGLNDHNVGKMVRVNVGANLQVISDVLNNDMVWSFSLAGDGSSHFGVSFFDVRVRLCVGGRLFNIHLVCVPFYDRHTAVNICKMICKLLDHLCGSWRSMLLSVSTDGENTMTGWKGGFVTLMDKEATNDVLRVWCPPHQMDLVIRDATLMVTDGTFAKTTPSFTVHLR